jgi:MATE family multidrug resistance protein
MITMIAANVLNVPLNIFLVWGIWFIPPLGAEGSAWATTTVRWMLALSMIAYVWFMRDHACFEVRAPRVRLAEWWRASAHQRRLGYAAGASLSLESASFATLGLFAGVLGPLALGAYTITLNLIALPFMSAVGLASATGVRVGVAYGRRDRHEMMMAGWTGLAVTSAILALIATTFALFPDKIAALFTTEPSLLAVTMPLVAFSALILIADGGQVVMANALRGRGDTWVPTALHFFSYFGVMIPVAAVLALWLDRGVLGLFEGILIASIVSITVLSVRFHVLSRAAI